MGARGPVPTPKGILQARGSRLAASITNEPQYPAGAPKCPAWLPAAAKREWKRIVPLLEEQRMVTQADLGPLACYCVAVSELEDATRTLEREGRMLRVGGHRAGENGEGGIVGGQWQPHPAIAQQRSAWAAVKQFSSMFGFSPSCRTRVKAAPKPEEPKPEGKARFFDPGA